MSQIDDRTPEEKARYDLLLADAKARQRGVDLDGSPRRDGVYSRAPAAAETAEREAERRYPAHHLDGRFRALHAVERDAFKCGAWWQAAQQREQSALSSRGEREEAAQALLLAAGRLTWAAQANPGVRETEGAALVLGFADDAQQAAARLRSAPSEAASPPCTTTTGGVTKEVGMSMIGKLAERLRAENETAPSPAPEQRAETAPLKLVRELASWDATTDSWYGLFLDFRKKAQAVVSALPHPAPAADTAAVPRESLKLWRDLFHAAECPASAAEITRLLGETP